MASSTPLVTFVDYILFCCLANVATSNYGPYMEMKHMYTWDHLRTKHLQHESTFCNIRLKQIKHLEHTLAMYVYSHYNIFNIQTKALATYVQNRWNILYRYMQHTCIAVATYATFKSTFATSLLRTQGPPLPTQETFATWALPATYVWSRWNIWNTGLQHMCIAAATYATFK